MSFLHLKGLRNKIRIFFVNKVYKGTRCFEIKRKLLNKAGYKIGSGTWVGGRSTILNNTTIGKSCVIAACACVTKDVPDNSLVGGVPAKIIRSLGND